MYLLIRLYLLIIVPNNNRVFILYLGWRQGVWCGISTKQLETVCCRMLEFKNRRLGGTFILYLPNLFRRVSVGVSIGAWG